MKRWLLITLLVVATIAAIIVFSHLLKRMKQMLPPVSGPISSPFGPREAPVPGASTQHNGVDYAVPSGTEVVSPYDGEVMDRYSGEAGGLQLIIKHTNGYRTGYAHLSETLVNIGDQVKRGQPIARTGATGRVSGPHLHFTMRGPEGDYLDPQLYLA